MQSELKILLDELCIELGFCLPPDAIRNILEKTNISAEEFTQFVLLGEGMKPEIEIQHFRTIKNKFTSKFGGEVTESDYHS